MLKTCAVATLVLTMLAGSAVAQEPRGSALVDAQFEMLEISLGWRPSARVRGRLAQNGTQVTNIDAPGGDLYFVGACDENCRDVDLIVRDPSGREIGRDFSDVPMVAVAGAAAGRYTLEVSMADCTGQCHWSVGVFH